MINWAIANAKGTRALSEVKYQRRRLIARLQRDAKSASGLQDSLAVEEDLVEVQFPWRIRRTGSGGNGCALDILFNLLLHFISILYPSLTTLKKASIHLAFTPHFH